MIYLYSVSVNIGINIVNKYLTIMKYDDYKSYSEWKRKFLSNNT